MIRLVEPTDIDAFLAHVDQQMRENGRGATLRFALRAPSAEPDVERLRRPLPVDDVRLVLNVRDGD